MAIRNGDGEVARLVRSAAAAITAGWNQLVQEFAVMEWAVARVHRLSHADAADVSQPTWLRLLEHVGELNGPASVGGWLTATARRECPADPARRRADAAVVVGGQPATGKTMLAATLRAAGRRQPVEWSSTAGP